MMSREKLILQQTLHGYASGHQMIESSTELDSNTRKILDIKSDLTGRSMEARKMLPYFTAYPVPKSDWYVFAKTWYAEEMKRPGCVWTHSVLFSREDICSVRNVLALFSVFHRPDDGSGWDYSVSLDYECIETDVKEENIDAEKVKYFLYFLLTVNSPIFIPDVFVAKSPEIELFYLLCHLPRRLQRDISFCTRVYSFPQKLGNASTIQIFPAEIGEVSSLPYNNAVIKNSVASIKKYPVWVDNMSEDIFNEDTGELYQFFDAYSELIDKRSDYSEFARLYYYFKGMRAQITFSEMASAFLDVSDDGNEKEEDFLAATVNSLVAEESIFGKFESLTVDMPNLIDRDQYLFSDDMRKKIAKKLLSSSKGVGYRVLSKYIAGNYSAKGNRFIEEAIENLKPEKLMDISKGNVQICMVAVRVNPKLLLCRDLWRQSADIQRTLLYLTAKELAGGDRKTLLHIIWNEGTEDVLHDLYLLWGQDMLSYLDSIVGKTEKVDKKWYAGCTAIYKKNQKHLASLLKRHKDEQFKRKLFDVLDTTDKIVLEKIEANEWIAFYQDYARAKITDHDISACIKFVPVVFGTKYDLPKDMVGEVILPIYERAKDNRLSFEEWKTMEPFLPGVEVWQEWDRCLRIRLGLERQGYDVEAVLAGE